MSGKGTTADALADLQEALANIKRLVKDGVFTEQKANKARKEAQRDYNEAMAILNRARKEAKKNARAEESDDNETGQPKKWPCSDPGKCITAQTYESFSAGVLAVKTAFKNNTLFPNQFNCKEEATARANKPGGTGAGGRGYLDWEFNGGIGCRCVAVSRYRTIRTDTRRRACDTRITRIVAAH